MIPHRFLAATLSAVLLMLCAQPVNAIILYESGPGGTYDPSYNTTAPTGSLAGSGWQWEGTWVTGAGTYIGTPIGSNYFVTANHVGGDVGAPFVFAGATYTTTAVFNTPNSDLAIWRVSTPFPTYAPLYNNSDETGKTLVMMGLGVDRGTERIIGTSRGWDWGANNHVERWGTNTVGGVANAGAPYGNVLYGAFDAGVGPNEATLGVFDSGGGVFIKDPNDSVWKLAGVNLAADGPYYTQNNNSVTPFNASLFDASGLYVYDNPHAVWVPANNPGVFYATSISSNTAFITGVIGVPEPGSFALLALGLIPLPLVALRRRKLAKHAR